MSVTPVELFELYLQEVKAEDVEYVSDLLVEYGAHAITLTDSQDYPVLEPAPGETPLWPTVQLRAIFDNKDSLMICERLLQSLYPDFSMSYQTIEDKPWDALLAQEAQPLCFGKRLWVTPSHLSAPDKNAVSVILDAGLAFGTGTHPTTSLCLSWLDNYNISGKTVIDYGCGSGILLIAALKLGAKFAYGVDLDPQALVATENNATINHLSKTTYQLSDVAHVAIAEPVDVILANILLNPLLSLKTSFQEILCNNGYLVLSGILTTQASTLIDSYASHFELVERETLEEWALLVFKAIKDDKAH